MGRRPPLPRTQHPHPLPPHDHPNHRTRDRSRQHASTQRLTEPRITRRYTTSRDLTVARSSDGRRASLRWSHPLESAPLPDHRGRRESGTDIRMSRVRALGDGGPRLVCVDARRASLQNAEEEPFRIPWTPPGPRTGLGQHPRLPADERWRARDPRQSRSPRRPHYRCCGLARWPDQNG